jgi:hypothetical protein
MSGQPPLNTITYAQQGSKAERLCMSFSHVDGLQRSIKALAGASRRLQLQSHKYKQAAAGTQKVPTLSNLFQSQPGAVIVKAVPNKISVALFWIDHSLEGSKMVSQSLLS